MRRNFLFLRQKRGILTHKMMMLAFNILMAAVVGFTILFYVQASLDRTDFEKNYLSRDLSYLIDTIFFLPGDIEFEYNQDDFFLEKFTFDFKDNEIVVNGISKEFGKIPRKYYFGSDQYMGYGENSLQSPYHIIFEKKDNNVFLASHASGETIIQCPSLEIKQLFNEKNVFFDISHGSSSLVKEEDTGYVNQAGLKEEDLMLTIQTSLSASFPTESFSRTKQEFISIEDRIDKIESDDIVVSLHIGTDVPDKNDVIIYFIAGKPDSLKSRKLACTIGRAIYSSSDEFTGLKILPVSPDFLEKNDPFKIIDVQNPSVLIEMGNIEYSNGVTINQNTAKISSSIWKGLEDYYG